MSKFGELFFFNNTSLIDWFYAIREVRGPERHHIRSRSATRHGLVFRPGIIEKLEKLMIAWDFRFRKIDRLLHDVSYKLQ